MDISLVFDFDFGLLQIGKVVGVRFVDLCIEGKYKNIQVAILWSSQNQVVSILRVSKSIYLRTGYDG